MGGVLSRLRRRDAGASESTAEVADGDAGGDEGTGVATGTVRARIRMLPKLDPHRRFGAWLSRPLTSFHLMVSVAAMLTTLGLIMVLSASGVHSYDEDGSPWTIFARQVVWAALGVFACWFALRLPVRFMRRTAFLAFAVTIVLLVLVLIPGIGRVANGTRGWFVVGGLSMQPSELAKIAFVVWGAHLLAARRMERATLREMLVPLLPAAVIALALIVSQPDLGQTVSLGIILLALLWFAGLPLKVFLSSLLATVAAAAVLAISEGYRSDRVQSWLDPSADLQGAGYQARQAKFALANGGVFGDGLGQGTAKWNYLPNAHNDFIFAIVGEELGFIGAAGLLALFGVFAYTGMRIAKRSADPFLRLMTATATAWVIGQVFINVGYVIGLLPVTGIQLPLISAGGTSTATTLFMVGLMANAARHEPEAVAALRAGRADRMNRLLRLPLPEPYLPTRAETVRDRIRSRPPGARPAAKPATRARPAKAATGARPAKAATGARPAKAATGARPAKPATRARPAKAATRARPAKAATGARTAKAADSAVPRRAAPRGATPRRTAAASDKRATRAVAKPREWAAPADNMGRAQHSSGRGGQNGGASDSRRAGAAKAHGIGRPRRSRTLEGQRYG